MKSLNIKKKHVIKLFIIILVYYKYAVFFYNFQDIIKHYFIKEQDFT